MNYNQELVGSTADNKEITFNCKWNCSNVNAMNIISLLQCTILCEKL